VVLLLDLRSTPVGSRLFGIAFLLSFPFAGLGDLLIVGGCLSGDFCFLLADLLMFTL
jgi:hypothetical protein